MNNSSPEGNIFFAILICISVILLANGYQDSCGNEVCNEDLCSRIRCRGFPREDCKGSVWVADGKCGCCNNCIIPLELGARCNPLPGYGIPNPVRYCRSGLTCDCKKRICVRCPNCRPRFS